MREKNVSRAIFQLALRVHCIFYPDTVGTEYLSGLECVENGLNVRSALWKAYFFNRRFEVVYAF